MTQGRSVPREGAGRVAGFRRTQDFTPFPEREGRRPVTGEDAALSHIGDQAHRLVQRLQAPLVHF